MLGDDCLPGKQVIVKPISRFLETIPVISGIPPLGCRAPKLHDWVKGDA